MTSLTADAAASQGRTLGGVGGGVTILDNNLSYERLSRMENGTFTLIRRNLEKKQRFAK